MIRFVVVDDHPSTRVGLTSILEDERDFRCLAAAEDEHGLWRVLGSSVPDVALLDYHLAGLDGLHLCRRVKRAHSDLPVVILSAWGLDELLVPTVLAGADGLLSKTSTGAELRAALRTVVGGSQYLPPVSPAALERAANHIPDEDLPLLGMLMQGTAIPDACAVLGKTVQEVSDRIDRLIGRLAPS